MSGSPVTVTGLQGQEGETAFAFLVLRLREPRARDAVVALLRYLAPLIPDADAADALALALVQAQTQERSRYSLTTAKQI
jgi:hypothetical protein